MTSHNDTLIGSRIRSLAFDWYQNHRPWMTLNALCRRKDASLTHCTNLNEDKPIGAYYQRQNVGQ